MFAITKPSPSAISSAAKALIDGALVGIPTETVYGLAADAENEAAVARIYSVKGRPQDHPVIVHIGSAAYLTKWAINIPDYAMKLAKKYWPGPMTLVLERSEIAHDFITGGQDTVGLRVPAHSVTLSILEEFHKLGGNGIAAPSANLFGAVSPTNAEAVQSELGIFLDSSKDLILDGGQSLVGVESTIIDCTSTLPKVLRPGSIGEKDINITTNLTTSHSGQSEIRTSGTHKKHYSPRAKVVLNEMPLMGDGYLALKNIVTPAFCHRLAEPSNAYEFARILYSAMREADNKNLNRIVIVPPEGNGIEVAIRDRINRASK